jgi:hypothetical protein
MPKVTITATKGLVQDSGNGQVLARGTAPALVQKYAAPAASIGTSHQTITIAQILTGILEEDPAGASTWTLPTNALLRAGLPDPQTGDTIDFCVINTDATAGIDITVAAGLGGTGVGSLLVQSADVAADAICVGSGMFRIRLASATAYVVYRLA